MDYDALEGKQLEKCISLMIDLINRKGAYDSAAFRKQKQIEKLGIDSVSHIMFVIGGSLGLDKRVLDRADFKLSFSPMTFPHQLMRVILLEQIYRSYRIMKNEPYHK